MVEIVPISSIVEANGKTVRENNLEIKHQIPLGTLVEVKYDRWFGDGACYKIHARLWVISHDRDCDGTPQYGLSHLNDPDFVLQPKSCVHGEWGFREENLTVVELTPEVRSGDDVLEWPWEED